MRLLRPCRLAGKEKKCSDLEAQAAELQQRVSQQKELYEQVTRTLAWEFDRYNANKNRDMLAALQNHAFACTDFCSKEHELWGVISAGVVARVHKVTSEAGALANSVDSSSSLLSPATFSTPSLPEPPPPAPTSPTTPPAARKQSSADPGESSPSQAIHAADAPNTPEQAREGAAAAAADGNPFAASFSPSDHAAVGGASGANPFAQPASVGSFY